MSDDAVQMGERLRALRRQRGWSTGHLAYRVDCSQTTICKIEAGQIRYPRRLDQIADALGVHPCWLLFGFDPPDTSRTTGRQPCG